MLKPGACGHPVGSLELIETHISWVILTGTYAYKIKKPVDLGFLDFSTLAKRHHYCTEEVRLNRRLAPAFYLGVIPVTGSPDAPHL
ncbi:MAG TPA: aminoglycoside phosphotransferase, partial [Gammaproteobacteria bacterium]|nr:aminoglycoside phosphotransferase [Gammaproteobacteria bacterium]